MTRSNQDTIRDIKLIREFSHLGMIHPGNLEQAITEIIKILVIAQVNRDHSLLSMVLQQLYYIAPESGDGS